MKNKQTNKKIVSIFVLLTCFFHALTVSGSEGEKNLATFIQFETEFSKNLVDLKNRLGEIVDPEKYQEQLVEISRQIDRLKWQIQMAKTDPDMPYEQLSIFDLKLRRKELALKKIAAPLTKSIQLLSRWEVDWSGEKKELGEWQRAISQDTTFAMVRNNIDTLTKATVGALNLIDNALHPAIATGQEVSKLQVRTYALSISVGKLIKERKEKGVEQTMPSFFSVDFFQLFGVNIFQITFERAKKAFQDIVRIAADHVYFLVFNFIALFFLAVGIKYSTRFVEPSKKWYFFAQKPVSVAFFFLSLLYLIFHSALAGTLINLEIILQIFVSITVILLMNIFIGYTSTELWLLRSFAFLLIVTWLFRIINLPTLLMQFFIATLSLVMFFYCLWQSWYLQRQKKKKVRVFFLRLVSISFAVTFFGMILGYEPFARYIFTSLLIGVVAARVVFLIYFLAIAAVEIILLQIPSKLVHDNRFAIVNRLIPVVGLCSVLLYVFILLKEWHVYPTQEAAANALLSMGVMVGGFEISPRTILLAVGTVYAVYMFSRAIQKSLLDSIFPKYKVDLGVQLSMVRLIHYSVLVIGFIILLNLLGFELTKLTIIGGALGVGIGFGLQAIVNNFASGLILLFERPIKVGDTVQIGDDLGEVKKLGLRATVVSTFDNAEIVIPNSDLITAPVTNWTLSGRNARLKVPVGVAYGTDIQNVIEILMRCADENVQVLTQPRPEALFLAFGASSLDIELRVWIADFSSRVKILSDLNQEIESEFSQAGIEIPFPQSDLHIRSIDDQAAIVLTP